VFDIYVETKDREGRVVYGTLFNANELDKIIPRNAEFRRRVHNNSADHSDVY
jgi:hypothetical protein